ncbi:hypothetical protein HNR64_003006 [Spongiibacter marinus]|nr:hypothetical protein [Spongiibacter marinus]
MDIKSKNKEEIYRHLKEGRILTIPISEDPNLSNVLDYYLSSMELKYTYNTFGNMLTNQSDREWLAIVNLPNIFRLYFKYRHLLKIGYAWRQLRWIKVEINEGEYRLSAVKSKNELPRSIWGS